MTSNKTWVYTGEKLARYGFGSGHPFGYDRHDAFMAALQDQGLAHQVKLCPPVDTTPDILQRFHSAEYIAKLQARSKAGNGYLDAGDTPAPQGIYEAACTVAGTTLAALDQLINGHCLGAFVPIAGLHHARRDTAAGFCAINDCGIAIETLRSHYHLSRIAYVDIDAHHGDGVFYEFIEDPELCFVDFHEDGRFLYPGTGSAEETGKANAIGTKLNIPLPPGTDDAAFREQWSPAESFIEKFKPEIILLQCGADSLANDPITHLRYTEATHAFVTQRLCQLAKRYSQGRILAMGGGGYNRQNLGRAWCAVVEQLIIHCKDAST